MLEVTNEVFESALANVDNRKIMASVCRRYKGLMPADELNQRAYVALFKCLRSHDPQKGNKFTTSLQWFTHCECRKALRYQQRHPSHPPLPNGITTPPIKDEVLFVRECMSLLPSNYRNILWHYYFENRNLREIGEINGYSQVTAMNVLRKAEAEFRRLYGE